MGNAGVYYINFKRNDNYSIFINIILLDSFHHLMKLSAGLSVLTRCMARSTDSGFDLVEVVYECGGRVGEGFGLQAHRPGETINNLTQTVI